MTVVSLFLRALLSLALLVSGSSHAGMVAMERGGDLHVGHAQPASGGPCHDASHGHDMSHDAASVAMDGPGDDSGHAMADCCKAGTCRCACVHGLSMSIVEGADASRPTGSMQYVESGEATYLSPALAQLIRPPIA